MIIDANLGNFRALHVSCSDTEVWLDRFLMLMIVTSVVVLLCDEPTGALDSETGILVLEALERVSRELGTTTTLITHNVTIADMADRVLVMGNGRIVEDRVNAEKRAPSELSW